MQNAGRMQFHDFFRRRLGNILWQKYAQGPLPPSLTESIGSEICASQALDSRERSWRKGGHTVQNKLNIRHLVLHYFGRCNVR